eukprot:2221628-Amphidinium_carterae.1
MDGSRPRWFATAQDYSSHQRASHLPLLESLRNLGVIVKTFSQKVHVLGTHRAHRGSEGAGKPH